ncbi:MAG TPA: DUF4402 domain-containing protein [Phenylobacterium sp.]|nr:DUF4402 domain-containing protein [Phenylobacterium sp.]
MKRVLLAASAALMIGSIASPALAQVVADDDATASITILAPITVTKDTDLQLGSIVVSGAGSYQLAGNGTVTDTAGTVDAFAGGVTPAVATFDITADASATYDVDVADDVTLTSGANTLTLSTSEAGLVVNGGTGLSGNRTVSVGGRIVFAGTEPAGTYTGTVNLQAAYN